MPSNIRIYHERDSNPQFHSIDCLLLHALQASEPPRLTYVTNSCGMTFIYVLLSSGKKLSRPSKLSQAVTHRDFHSMDVGFTSQLGYKLILLGFFVVFVSRSN
jgi:hypothetical protein